MERIVNFLILSSYDYFAYAQEAIRLGVDDFILKPYNIADMLQAVEKVMEKQKVKSVEKQTKNELLDKLEKYTPIMENECFYKIMSNEDDLSLKQALLLLDKQNCLWFLYRRNQGRCTTGYEGFLLSRG